MRTRLLPATPPIWLLFAALLGGSLAAFDLCGDPSQPETFKTLSGEVRRVRDIDLFLLITWTPGWGWFRSPAGEALFHVGMEEGCENYVVLFPAEKTGIVIQSVSDLSVRVSPSIAKQLIGDVYSPFSWMRY